MQYTFEIQKKPNGILYEFTEENGNGITVETSNQGKQQQPESIRYLYV